MFASGAAAMSNNVSEINELNVFPVPDGDTGTNMSLTMNAGLKELNNDFEHAGHAAAAVASGLLRGARGNSGVILSLLFRGFAKKVEGFETINGADFAKAMCDGVETAYRAVMKPSEGTMLTVSRVSSKAAAEYAKKDPDLDRVMGVMLESAEAALAETIYQNPVLEKAGVIDAGGKGLCVIFEGMLSALRGEPVLPSGGTGAETRTAADFSEFSGEDMLFGYCTEFIIKRPQNDKKDPARLRAFLENCGDSLVFVEDDEIIKVHVHTDNPGRVLAQALIHGELTAIKIENMREQHTEMVENEKKKDAKPTPPPKPVELKPYGFVCVCAGGGLKAIFKDLGVDRIVEGGQTMNPSTQDILDDVNQTHAETVFILPNNKNIIMAAEQCAPLTDKRIIVLPTKSVAQGVTAMLTFDPEQGADANRDAMTGVLDGVTTIQITEAARDSQFDGKDITEGDFIVLTDGALKFNDASRRSALGAAAREAAAKNPSYVTIYYGEGASLEEAASVSRILAGMIPSAEVQVFEGGQPVYPYVIAVE
jgi:DAK2 domain fusion protein YloV